MLFWDEVTFVNSMKYETYIQLNQSYPKESLWMNCSIWSYLEFSKLLKKDWCLYASEIMDI